MRDVEVVFGVISVLSVTLVVVMTMLVRRRRAESTPRSCEYEERQGLQVQEGEPREVAEGSEEAQRRMNAAALSAESERREAATQASHDAEVSDVVGSDGQVGIHPADRFSRTLIPSATITGQPTVGERSDASQPSGVPHGGLPPLSPQPQRGLIWAWGSNDHGQLGDGTRDVQPAPVMLQRPANVKQVVAGYRCAFAVQEDGTAWSWGDNDFGKLGDDAEDAQPEPVRITGLADIVMIAAGARTTYALRRDGTVWSWGGNAFHELGAGLDATCPQVESGGWSFRPLNGDEVGTRVPVRVHGLSEVMAIAAGGSRAFALRADGTVWAWGDNQRGRLGDGTTVEHLAPVRLKSLTDVVALAVGERSAYALDSSGTVWAWGDNGDGQLGDGSRDSRGVPGRVRGLGSVAAVAAGSSSAYALGIDGAVWAWGCNRHGQVGDGTQSDRLLPVPLVGLTGVSQIAAGWTSAYALTRDGSVWAWGDNSSGQLGVRRRREALVPTQELGFSRISSISARKDTVYALAQADDPRSGYTEITPPVDYTLAGQSFPAGTVWAWGRNDTAQLGDGSRDDRLAPVPVSGLADIKHICTPKSRGFDADGLVRALMGDGTVWAWGGRYMNGAFQGLRVPRQIEQESGVVALVDFFALKGNGKVKDLRVLHDDQRPKRVPGLADADAIYPLQPLLYVAKKDGALLVYELSNYDWEHKGDYYWGGKQRQLEGPADVVSVVSWRGETRRDVALAGDGTVWEWNVENLQPDARNQWMADFAVTQNPAPIADLKDVRLVSAGTSCCYALKADGSVWAWGGNHLGQLGDGTMAARTNPVKVDRLTNVVAIDPLGDSCLALREDGSVWAWGDNEHGQLGDGTRETRTKPIQALELSEIKALHAGFAIRRDGTVWAWGDNQHGRLADGTEADRPLPRQIEGLSSVIEVVAGSASWFAITDDSPK